MCFRLCVNSELDEPFARGSQLQGEIGKVMALPDREKPYWGLLTESILNGAQMGIYDVTSGIAILGVNLDLKEN